MAMEIKEQRMAMSPRAAGLTSASSEASVFDFKESDSESEMPVLEKQSLDKMRRDRKQLSKVQPPMSLNEAISLGIEASLDIVKIEIKVGLMIFFYAVFLII